MLARAVHSTSSAFNAALMRSMSALHLSRPLSMAPAFTWSFARVLATAVEHFLL